ncbi:histidine kinase dimerization/phosphoacceptor domain -containing protein [Phenylobacterium sp.]|uniref:sensor histidine kinase n=1 Tax=Phenylobacterium sp. TaxID=1871053 RepID=UPI0030F3AF78
MAEGPLDRLLDTTELAAALDSDQFKQFLDQVPVAIAVAELQPAERIIYANHEFERLTGQSPDQIVGVGWEQLPGVASGPADMRELGLVITDERDHLGAFSIRHDGDAKDVDAWSNLIEDETGTPTFRMVALVERPSKANAEASELEQRIAEKDTLLRELQHRVKNNLQMITALIRVEARALRKDADAGEGFDRLAGRVEALGLLYNTLTEAGSDEAIDLGVYVSQIASAVMRAHAVEGIHLELQVDTWPVSVDVAMSAGLVVNELLTNALKHAFKGRDGGAITVKCLTDSTGCRVTVADDGVGLPDGGVWPTKGKLSALIVKSLLQNAKAEIDVRSSPGMGVRVMIFFACADAAPAS